MTEVIANKLKQLLAERKPSYVLTARFARTTDIVGISSASGHDALYVDLQHSVISLDETAQICQVGLASGITTLVRIPSIDAGLVGRLLDAGAQGIIAPDIETAEQAAALVQACRFPPHGSRSSAGSSNPHTRFRPMPTADFQLGLDAETLVICMIESPRGVENTVAIASTLGVDAVQIGANDLTTSMGIPGQYSHPDLQVAFRKVIDACNAVSKPMIVGGVKDAENLSIYLKMGAARCYFTGNDTAFLIDGASRQNSAMRKLDLAMQEKSAQQRN